MISQKVRNNASISYFFLGWLFLLAKNNPNFADPFIKQHAKLATKGHILFFVTYLFYSHFLSNFFSYSIPVLHITIDYCISIAFFLVLTLFIIKGVYRGQKEDTEKNNEKNDTIFSVQGNVFHYPEASEAQRIILLLSHIPFLSMIVANKYQNTVTITGVRISSIFWFLYIISLIGGWFNSLSMILLFIWILALVFLAARFFLNNNYTIPALFEKIPETLYIYEIIRSVPSYLVDIGKMVFGKKNSISFEDNLKNTREKDKNLKDSLQKYFTDETLSFKSFWIFIPFFNLLFLPKLFISRTTKYVLAIGQWLIITLLVLCIGFFSSFTSPFLLLLLFPIFYGISSLEKDIFIQIPLLYEIYVMINTITFGLLNNTKRLQTVQKQDTVVSFKID